DDKIIRRAAEEGIDWRALAERYTTAMHEDLALLGCMPPDKEPRASQYITEMLAMIGQLIERGYAYVASNGDVMYAVHKFEGYGRLSGKRLEDLRAGARVEVDVAKRDPLDFVLWKSAKPGEPSWPSPWGAGRPGWHIECSAMSTHELGPHFDIHGGGLDLKFPHHENEIAQTCGATGDKFAEIWMHNGFLNIDSEKMSKSLGNFFTTREVLKQLKHPEVLRYFLLSSHYRGPINYSREQLAQAEAALGRLYNSLRDLPVVAAVTHSAATAAFEAVMDDDFNTPEALAVLQGLARAINSARDAHELDRAAVLAGELQSLGAVLGILTLGPADWFRAGYATGLDAAAIDARVAARLAARQAKDWATSDRIRDELAAQGVVVEDKPGGKTVWRRT
ncbi:MAG TPA: cysteine--tRNA ligase, partial [Steroidobacteraceae bacterium]|nr:cysteine--tRNA ligase [Steroidobacteraceae bacterium]